MAILHTKRMSLRPCSPEDRADFVDLELDPEVMLYLNGGHAILPGQEPAEASFLMPRGTEPHVWTARRRESGAFVGWFCLWPESGSRAELGYRLRRAEWGHGLATEGAGALVDWGFSSAGYETILACTMAVNQGSRRVMEKTGLQYSHTEFPDWAEAVPGSEHGEVWYEATRSAYLKARSTA